ncbi:dUTP diphosphatase [Streptomyces sp. NBC_01186]|uniref:dUTP diphosphatase n=1 Tax=Streptomyces sp. NBC_01186 TaxID=2903765 RepID=UPI002E0F238B|nr:dUTP diphosphatase [Streptomyces sp. NBC_01186]
MSDDAGTAAGPQATAPGGGPVEVLLRRVDPEVPVPSYAHPGDAGCDLVTTESAVLAPGERTVLPTGVSLALPEGYAAFVHPRSGLAARCGVCLVNAPGTVDAGYRGEIKVIVANLDPRESVRFERFDRIAQLVVQQVEKVRFREVDELPGSVRATAGFGSTGGHAGARDAQQTAAQQKDYVAVGADRAADLRGQ